MGKTLSQEEQKQTLQKLESDLVATRFMTLKYVSYTLIQDKVDYAKMDMEWPEFTKSLIRIIDFIAQNDKIEMVKREAILCLENLKKKVNPAILLDSPICSSCGERVVLSFKFCTKCGAEMKGQKWVFSFKQCEICQSPVDPAWFNCSNCGNTLIKKVDTPKNCPMCKKAMDPGWMLCPFCGSKIKLV
jgi:predicted Zn-ribbon and HTH transcriptional regulator